MNLSTPCMGQRDRKGETVKQLLMDALVFTDFQWVTFHLDEKSPFRTSDPWLNCLQANALMEFRRKIGMCSQTRIFACGMPGVTLCDLNRKT